MLLSFFVAVVSFRVLARRLSLCVSRYQAYRVAKLRAKRPSRFGTNPFDLLSARGAEASLMDPSKRRLLSPCELRVRGGCGGGGRPWVVSGYVVTANVLIDRTLVRASVVIAPTTSNSR